VPFDVDWWSRYHIIIHITPSVFPTGSTGSGIRLVLHHHELILSSSRTSTILKAVNLLARNLPGSNSITSTTWKITNPMKASWTATSAAATLPVSWSAI
jgi:hypothetical protein